MDETIKCPACGADLKLEDASAATQENETPSMPSMDEAQKMPLADLRNKLPKKAE